MASRNKRKRRAARPSPSAASPKATVRPGLLNGLFSLVIVAGLFYLIWPTGGASPETRSTGGVGPVRRVVPAPPTAVAKAFEGGARVVRFDPEALRAWCRAISLPEPPDLGPIEPRIADTLRKALRSVAASRSAANLGKLGQMFESLDCHQAADAYFKLAEQADPRAFRWPYYRACIDQLLGRGEEALATFVAAESLRPDYAILHARVGQLHLEAGDLEAAERRFGRYVELRPNDSLGYVGLGRIALSRGQAQEALAPLRSAVALGPNDFQAHFYLGQALVQMGDRDQARVHFETATKLPQGKWYFIRDPLDQELHQSIGSSQELVGYFERLAQRQDFAQLAKAAEDVLAYRPRDTKMMANLASIYRKQKRYEEAHALLDKASKIQPDLLRVFTVRAAIYLAQNKFSDAIGSANQVLNQAPDRLDAVNIRGRALLLLGRFAEAEDDLRRVAESDPEDVGKAYVFGEVCRLLGKAEEAKNAYRRALELNPSFAPARQRLDELD